MSSKLWVLLTALMVFPVSCKEPAKASKKSPGAENASPQTTTQSERPESTEDSDEPDDDEDKCKNSSGKKDEEDDDDDDDELGLRLTGKSVTSKVTVDVQKKESVKKKSSKKRTKKKSKKTSEKSAVPKTIRGFGLLASDPTYDDDIRSILSDKCESCHASGDKYALDTYTKAKGIKTKIGEQVESGDMPPKNKSPLTSAEKSSIKKWIDAGVPESASVDETTEDEDEDEDEQDESDDCDDDEEKDDDKNASAADWDDLLKSKEVKKCSDKDKIFDRLKETCHKAKIASFACDKSGVVKAFKDLSISVESQYNDFISDGYKIDQCGEYGNEPVVLFYKKKEENKELKLLIKKLCKKGSDACDN